MQEKRNAFFGSDQGVTYYHQNMVGDTLIREREDIPKGLDYVEHMRWSYSVVLDRRKSHIHDTLVLLSQEGNLPALVHCAGGTERTGLIVGLVLGIVGVPDQTIAEDFALTARLTYDQYLKTHPEVDADSYSLQDHQDRVCRPDTMLAVLRTRPDGSVIFSPDGGGSVWSDEVIYYEGMVAQGIPYHAGMQDMALIGPNTFLVSDVVSPSGFPPKGWRVEGVPITVRKKKQ